MINSWSGVSVIHKESRGLTQNWFLGGAVQKDWVFGLVFGMRIKIEFFFIFFSGFKLLVLQHSFLGEGNP
jgi:hypothetical protein